MMFYMNRYLFWDRKIMKEISDADDAARAVERIGKKVLEEYRRKHTEEYLQNDKSILAHLIRRCSMFYSTPLYFNFFYCVLFRFVLFCYISFYSFLRHLTSLYCTTLYCIIFY